MVFDKSKDEHTLSPFSKFQNILAFEKKSFHSLFFFILYNKIGFWLIQKKCYAVK